MLLQLCLSSFLLCTELWEKDLWLAVTLTRQGTGGNGFSLRDLVVLLKSAPAQSWYLPLGKQCPTCCSWWGSSSQLLLRSQRHYQGIAVNQLISNAASVWARRCATTCRNAAGAAPSCSCTRQPSHRHCFICTVLLNGGGGIVMLTRKQEHGST